MLTSVKTGQELVKTVLSRTQSSMTSKSRTSQSCLLVTSSADRPCLK